MTTCGGCKQHELLLAEVLCLSCVEDLKLWLKTIPALYDELGSVRLPGSVRVAGPYAKTSSMGGAAPVRLAVVDLADRGEVVARLRACWPEDWAVLWGIGYDVEGLCTALSRNLLNLVMLDEAPAMYRKVRGLVRDLGRAVGEPQDLAVGKCPRPLGPDGELCRGQLLRAGDTTVVYCRRCGDRPAIVDQQVWVTATEAHLIVGKPIKTVRNWFNRGLVGWGPPVLQGLGWLPIIVRRAALATISQSSDTVNLGSGAEPSKDQRSVPVVDTSSGCGLVSDADVLGRVAPGNDTPPVARATGTDVAPDSLGTAAEQGPQYSASDGETGPSRPAVPATAPVARFRGDIPEPGHCCD
jgi:hypothetical protein